MEPDQPEAIANPPETVNLKMIGVGGAGTNAVDRLRMENLSSLKVAAVNTDTQALGSSPVEERLLLGAGVTRGLGAGGDPERGRLAAEADRDRLRELVEGVDLAVILAGMGGGTGSGAAPVLAEVASEAGALVMAFVTMPFTFEGGRRARQAEEGLIALRSACDAVVPLPNDLLLQQSSEKDGVLEALAMGDRWIDRAVTSIWAMLFRTGMINLDFASIRSVFPTRGGKTLFGLGYGEGADAADLALEDFRLCPLLHTPDFPRKSDRLLVNIIGGPDLTLDGVNHLMSNVAEEFGRDAHVTMGAVIDEDWDGRVELCVLGTTDMDGVGTRSVRRVARPKPRAASQPASFAGRGAPEGEQAPREIDGGDHAGSGAAARQRSPAVTATKPLQEEFAFSDEADRGYFEPTDHTLYHGEDLDRPTFLRRGVRIPL
ncbi:MAG: cell division protein FtsZ [Puniceicoccaceae bacterium]|nr:MAG: cell division protein FtsZ [Puniceicoccaceae bacterium]